MKEFFIKYKDEIAISSGALTQLLFIMICYYFGVMSDPVILFGIIINLLVVYLIREKIK